jgi:hypothetical protein
MVRQLSTGNKSLRGGRIVAGNGVKASFLDLGLIDLDRGSGATAGRRGSMAGSRSRSMPICPPQEIMGLPVRL